MAQNPPHLRPDLAPKARIETPRPGQPTIGMVSLGCPKALVDSERILTRLRAEGYAISPDYSGAEAVIVNTCGFLDSAKAESLEAIGEALHQNGKVIVTGCLGANPEYITGAHPKVLAVTGPHQYEQVLDAVHAAVPPAPDPFVDLLPASGVSLTPRHYSYLKISEGCNHKCKFCIIPDMRGKLVSRPPRAILREAEKLVEAGVRELLVISQDTSAYGIDIKTAAAGDIRPHITDLARELGQLGAWVRLHYVYPYPHVRHLIPLMAEGLILPYLDIPFQHAHPDVLKRMARPAAASKTLDEIAAWRADCPISPCDQLSSSAIPARLKQSFKPCSIGWMRRSSTGLAVFNMRTSPARAPMTCPIMCPKMSSRSAGAGLWRRHRPFPRRNSRPNWANAWM
jgi:ribosomal protein S12 methylthiotransferase